MGVAHIDDDYPTLAPNGWALGLFIFLTPVRSRGGAFIVFDGSPYRYRTRMLNSPDQIKLFVSQTEYSGPGRELLAEPGDVVLFHHLMGHVGSSNVSDPVTRHALLTRFHPRQRIVPGRKPLDKMSTIEKANSTRYLQRRIGNRDAAASQPIITQPAEAVLRQGFASQGGIVAHDTLRFEGRTHAFYVDTAEPGVVRHSHSGDWSQWKDEPALRLEHGVVSSINHHVSGADVLLILGVKDGGHAAEVWSSRDLSSWSFVASIPNAGCGTGHWNSSYGSKKAHGEVLLHVSADHPNQIRCRSGKQWLEIGKWTDHDITFEAAADVRILDLTMKPVLGEQVFGLLMDIETAGGSGASSPHFIQSRDSARYDGPLQQLGLAAPAVPRQVRVYMRARNYWLVTYLRENGGSDRMFWGAIDWNLAAVQIQEIRSIEAMEDSLCVVGLI
jgi:hypothetical protein